MSKYTKGSAALGRLKTNSEGGGGGVTNEFTPFNSGSTLKVKVKGTEDIMQYFGYGVYKKVNTFVAKNPSVRNDRGFVESNPTPWDKAASYYYDLARKAEEAGKDDEAEELRRMGYQFLGKERYAIGFFDLSAGKDIVVDFTRNQARDVYDIIERYAKKLDSLAFILSKTGQRNDTKVTLMPIIDMDEELTDEERKNFESAKGQPFDSTKFDGLLYEADEDEQIEFLKTAGFDVSLIGGGGSDSVDEDDDPTKDF